MYCVPSLRWQAPSGRNKPDFKYRPVPEHHCSGEQRRMKAIIQPGRAAGTVQAPPSKSIDHRMLICSGLTGGLSNLSGVSGSRDIVATMGALSALGAEIKRSSSGSIQVRGTGAPGVFSAGCSDSSEKKRDSSLDRLRGVRKYSQVLDSRFPAFRRRNFQVRTQADGKRHFCLRKNPA